MSSSFPPLLHSPSMACDAFDVDLSTLVEDELNVDDLPFTDELVEHDEVQELELLACRISSDQENEYAFSKEQQWLEEQQENNKSEYGLMDGDKFDWASSAAIAILGPPSNTVSGSSSFASTPSSSTAPSISASVATTCPSTPVRSPIFENKIEPGSPEPIRLTAGIASSTPSSISPSPSVLTSSTSSPSLSRSSSAVSLQSRIGGLCLSIIQQVSQSCYTQELLESVVSLRQLVSSRSFAPSAMTLSTPILPAFVAILSSSSASAPLLLEVAWCMTNIASGSSTNVQALIEAGCLPPLLALLHSSQHSQVSEQVVWCLGNVAGDGCQARDKLLELGLMERLCRVADSEACGSELLKHIAWCIHNLCRNKPVPNPHRVGLCVPTVKRLLLGTPGSVGGGIEALDNELLPDLLGTLACLSLTSDALSQRLLSHGFLEYLIRLLSQLQSLSLPLLTPAMRTLGNFLTGCEQDTQLVLDAGFLAILHQLLRYPLEQVRKEACWTASNIAAGSRAQKQALLDEDGMLSDVMDLARTANTSVRKEACYVLSNLCEGGDAEQLNVLLSAGVIDTLSSALFEGSRQLYPVATQGLQCLLRQSEAYKDRADVQQLEVRLRAFIVSALTAIHGAAAMESVGDDVLGPVRYSSPAEQRWGELLDGADDDEQDRLTMMRNVLTVVRYRDEDDTGESAFERGEERRREENDDVEEEEEEDEEGETEGAHYDEVEEEEEEGEDDDADTLESEAETPFSFG